MNKENRKEVGQEVALGSKIIRPKKISKEEDRKRCAAEWKRQDFRGENIGLIPEVPKNLKEKYANLVEEAQKTSKALETWKRFEGGWNLPKDDRRTLNEQWWNTKAVMKATGRTGIKGLIRKIFRKKD